MFILFFFALVFNKKNVKWNHVKTICKIQKFFEKKYFYATFFEKKSFYRTLLLIFQEIFFFLLVSFEKVGSTIHSIDTPLMSVQKFLQRSSFSKNKKLSKNKLVCSMCDHHVPKFCLEKHLV